MNPNLPNSIWSRFALGVTVIVLFGLAFFLLTRGGLSEDTKQQAAAYTAEFSFLWCDVKTFFSFSCPTEETPSLPAYDLPVTPYVTETPPPQTRTTSPATTTIVQYVTNETTVRPVEREIVREVIIRDEQIDTSNFITWDNYDRQVNALLDSVDSSSSGASEALDELTESLAAAVDTDLLTVSGLSTLDTLSVGTTTNIDTFTLDGMAYFAALSSVPTTTTNRLYNLNDSLYWSGSPVSGTLVGTWTSDGTHAWRPTGHVGIGDITPASLFTVGANDAFQITSAGVVASGTWNGTDIDISDYTNLGVTATGLSLSGDNIALTSGYVIPLTASTTAWNTFYDTPSTRITAGTNIDWTGNTLNVDTDLANYNNTNTAFIDLTDLSSTATGLTYNNTNGQFSLTGGYNIPFTASTTEWSAAHASTTALTPSYIRGLWSETVTGLDYSSGVLSLTSGYNIPLTTSTTNWNTFYDTPSNRITAGDALTWSGNTLNFDGGDTPGGVLGGTWASPTLDDNYVLNTGDSISGDISIGTTTQSAKFTIQSTGTTDILNLFETGGSEVFTVLESGNVGIGGLSSSIGAKLHVTASTSAGTHVAGIFGGGASGTLNDSVDVRLSTNPSFADLRGVWLRAINATGSGQGHDFAIYTNPASATPLERFRITSTGNVGIGTTTPVYPLSVTASSNALIQTYNSTNYRGGTIGLLDGFNMGINSNGGVTLLQANATTYLTLGSSGNSYFNTGNIGIGTSTPSSSLHIASNGATDLLELSSSAGASLLHVTADGRFVMGTSTPYDTSGAGFTPAFQIHGTNNQLSSFYNFRWHNVAAGAVNNLAHSRGATVGTHVALQLNDNAGTYSFSGSDGTSFNQIANITASVDDTVSTGIVPGRLTFSTTDTSGTSNERMRITSAGLVGIGTTSPQKKLEVVTAHEVGVDDAIRIGSYYAGTFYGLGLNYDIDGAGIPKQHLVTYYAGSKVTNMTLSADGYVGIGTTTPSAKLAITGTAGTGDIFAIASSTEARLFTVTSAGYVGIGTTTPGGALSASGRGYLQGIFQSTETGNSGGIGLRPFAGDHWEIQAQGSSVSPADSLVFYNRTDSAYRMVVTGTGNVGIGDSTPDYKLDVWGTICQDTNSDDICDGSILSDERLKENVYNIENPLDKLAKLRGVTFEWREDNPHTLHVGRGTTHVGMIAQEVERVFPSLIMTDMDGYKMVDYQKLVGPLIEGVNELHFSLEDLVLNGTPSATSTFASLPEDSFWSRLTRLVGGFFDGVLTVAGIKADEGEFGERLCIDGTCITGDQLRALLSGSNIQEHEVDEGNEDEEVVEDPEETPPPVEEPTEDETPPTDDAPVPDEEVEETPEPTVDETPEEEPSDTVPMVSE